VKFTAILLVALLVSVPAILAQDATATPTSTPDLLSAQFKNQTAQADYYSEQAHPNFWNSLPVIGASLAAVVAFVSLLFNLWMTQHNQHNNQFYEALKRFGDKDSLQTRSIAATLLVEMTVNHSRFLDNTIDALSIGLLTDMNDVALDAYKTALSQIVRRKPQKCLPKLASTNRKLRHSLAKTLAEYLLVNEERGTPEKGIDAQTWETVEQLSQYGRAQLEKVFSDNGIGTLANELAEAKTRLGVNSKATIRDNFQVAAKRLRLIEQLLQEASQAKPRRWRSWQGIELPLEMK
jgi:hypothetical protein